MFTGIIEAVGTIKNIEQDRFTIMHNFRGNFKLGESIALSGMCTTIIEFTEQEFVVEVMEESRNCTVFGSVKVGDFVNLERAAEIGARNSGHFVLGHVDTTGEVVQREKKSDFELFRIKFPRKFGTLCVHKGSITVDGISLTISNLGEDWFEISIISHTLAETNLGMKKVGSPVNLEFDILGKYILRAQELSK